MTDDKSGWVDRPTVSYSPGQYLAVSEWLEADGFPSRYGHESMKGAIIASSFGDTPEMAEQRRDQIKPDALKARIVPEEQDPSKFTDWIENPRAKYRGIPDDVISAGNPNLWVRGEYGQEHFSNPYVTFMGPQIITHYKLPKP